jgi:hypothetical protein
VQTELEFVLPRGYVDAAGQVHRDGCMRLALALDEILSVGDPRVAANEAYLPIVLLSRVVTRLGSLPLVTPEVIGGLFAADLSYLEDLYMRFNSPARVILSTTCPNCSAQLQVQTAPLEN